MSGISNVTRNKSNTYKSNTINAHSKNHKVEREKDLDSNNAHSFYLDKSDVGLKDTLRP